MRRAKTSFWRNADLIILVVVLELWQFITGTQLNVRTALLVVGLCLISRFLGAVGQIESSDSAAPAEPEKREFVHDPDAVLEAAKLTGLDSIRAMTPYLGKWMTIAGKFEGMAESLQKNAIHLTLLLNDGRRVNLRFGVERVGTTGLMTGVLRMGTMAPDEPGAAA